MEGAPQREVVLEIEQTKIVRKRARTNLRGCHECRRSTDFISVTGAAGLFSTTASELLEFAQANFCHFRVEGGERILLCLPNLLAAMSRKLGKGTIKLLGD